MDIDARRTAEHEQAVAAGALERSFAGRLSATPAWARARLAGRSPDHIDCASGRQGVVRWIPSSQVGRRGAGDSLQLEVIAERIEHLHQADRLRAMRSPLGQGFLYSRPIRPEAVLALLQTSGALLSPGAR